ncbi:MAG: hypothetical protein L6V93_17925 [Clostridiales bacterium]|nr:MAG: hypothetical protein L6V93_17925 [Clostridiales bacterium]
MEAIMQIKSDGSYYPGAEGIDNDPARARFAEGNIGMKIGYSWDVGVLNDQFPCKNATGVLHLFPHTPRTKNIFSRHSRAGHRA